MIKIQFQRCTLGKIGIFYHIGTRENNRVAVYQLIKYDLLRPLAYRKKFSAVIGVPLKNVILFAIESSRSPLRKKFLAECQLLELTF
jgi:hypothetical protein